MMSRIFLKLIGLLVALELMAKTRSISGAGFSSKQENQIITELRYEKSFQTQLCNKFLLLFYIFVFIDAFVIWLYFINNKCYCFLC